MSVKSELLRNLEVKRGESISGQELADRLGVSRNAIWKAVKALQEDGYRISSATNRGYLLEEDNDIISEEGIRNFLTEEFKQLRILKFDSIDSTNDEAKRQLASGVMEPLLIVSKEQTNGHGRRGRSFYSPKETGIYMSVLFHTGAQLEDAVSVTTATSVIVTRAIRELTGKEPRIKWVNDIYLNEKKICGILTEAILNCESGETPGIIVGVGVNVCTTDFPKDIQTVADSLGGLKKATRNQLIAAIAEGILRHAGNVQDHSYIEDYRKFSMVIGKEIAYSSQTEMLPAVATGIDENGGLIIRLPDGSQKVLSSGEITIRVKK